MKQIHALHEQHDGNHQSQRERRGAVETTGAVVRHRRLFVCSWLRRVGEGEGSLGEATWRPHVGTKPPGSKMAGFLTQRLKHHN